MSSAKVIVTGGAGYIGSHAVKALAEAGYDVLTYDNLSTGHHEAVLSGEFVEGDLADKNLLDKTIREFAPDIVMSFAASIQVEESMREPFMYYRNNVVNTLTLVETMLKNGVNKFIFSSTAATYGAPGLSPIPEETPAAPINPYGASKVMVERFLKDLSLLGKLDYMALRYFNVAGAHPDGTIGQKYKEATHLITRSVKTAKGEFDKLVIFGTDYPTKDGTCIRDYIHVSDLVDAHILAMERLLKTGGSDVFNIGYGKGFSVREVVEEAKKVTGVNFSVEEGERRDGDPPELVAQSSRIKNELGWSPKYDDISFIIKTAWEWERRLP